MGKSIEQAVGQRFLGRIEVYINDSDDLRQAHKHSGYIQIGP